MQQISEKKSLLYLSVVAHESNIFAVSRQLVIVSVFFVLCWKKKRNFSKTPPQDLAGNTATVSVDVEFLMLTSCG